MINLKNIILKVLNEDNVAGGEGSAFGSGVGGANQFSADTYAPGDTRSPFIFGGIIRRPGLTKKKRKKKRKKRK